MKNIITVGAALMLTTTAATAGGLDRSGQGIGAIFEDGGYAELSFGSVNPTVSGALTAAPTVVLDSGNVADSYTSFGFAFKQDINEKLSFALISDQPFGAAVNYDENDAGYPLATAAATLTSQSLTALARYKINENFSVHGGFRHVETQAEIRNIGGAYSADVESDSDVGYVAGVAYERKDIAMRVALTYSSETEFSNNTSVGPGGLEGPTEYTMPKSVNLDFQSGVAANTLVFGSIRWTEWSKTSITPFGYPAGPLVSYDNDSIAYNIGVGRKFSDTLAGSVSVGYEKATGGAASELSPTDGNMSIALGASYDFGNGMKLSAGARYVKIGDATTEFTGASFSGNSALGVGMKVAYTF
ncbi:MAG: outer membrane protein transport protein [Yoonia sp.]|nr:outer membrane protein transport protein [Yoonia sp.]